MSAIKYVQGDATQPAGDGPKIIAHVCNDIGRWGKGFVMAVSSRWPEPEIKFHEWFGLGADGGFQLGKVQVVPVSENLWVANMIGQRGIKSVKGVPPIRYEAIAECLAKLAEESLKLSASVHMPRIGCGLAGGVWTLLEPLIIEHLSRKGIAVTVYDFD